MCVQETDAKLSEMAMKLKSEEKQSMFLDQRDEGTSSKAKTKQTCV